jgi:hypothetical protein
MRTGATGVDVRTRNTRLLTTFCSACIRAAGTAVSSARLAGLTRPTIGCTCLACPAIGVACHTGTATSNDAGLSAIGGDRYRVALASGLPGGRASARIESAFSGATAEGLRNRFAGPDIGIREGRQSSAHISAACVGNRLIAATAGSGCGGTGAQPDIKIEIVARACFKCAGGCLDLFNFRAETHEYFGASETAEG